MTDRVFGWSQQDIDAAIPVVTAKLNEAIRKGDLVAAAEHRRWIDRLLDARPYHRPA